MMAKDCIPKNQLLFLFVYLNIRGIKSSGKFLAVLYMKECQVVEVFCPFILYLLNNRESIKAFLFKGLFCYLFVFSVSAAGLSSRRWFGLGKIRFNDMTK